MSNPPGQKQIPIYIDESVYRVFKIYSAETDQSIQDIVKPLLEEFRKGALILATEIQKMREKVAIERAKLEEEQRLATENPLQVLGHEVNPLGSELEQPITI